MNKDIFIFDNFLQKEEYNFLLEYINSNNYWKFGHSSGNSENIQTPFFSIMHLPDYFSGYIKTKIENVVSKKLNVNRNYMHIQTFGQDGCYHIDDNDIHAYTFCIYITEIKNDEFELAKGEFLVKNPKEKHIISIDTYCNRAVFFPSNYLHKGLSYDRLHSQKRICITWKLKEAI